MWFPHYEFCVDFGQRCIARGAPVAWSPWFPDIGILDFFMSEVGIQNCCVWNCCRVWNESRCKNHMLCSWYIRNTIRFDNVQLIYARRCNGGFFEHIRKHSELELSTTAFEICFSIFKLFCIYLSKLSTHVPQLPLLLDVPGNLFYYIPKSLCDVLYLLLKFVPFSFHYSVKNWDTFN